MKNTLSALALILIMLPFSGCNKNPLSPPDKGNTTGGVPVPGGTSGCDNLIVMSKNMNMQHYTDKYTVTSAAVSGDYLKIGITYGGSATVTHTFQLVWNDLSMRAMNVLELEHNANGDAGKALISDTKCYDISALRTQDAHGKVSFQLSGYNDMLTYTW